MDPLQQTYIVCGTLNHNGVTYADGTTLAPGFFTDAFNVEELRFFHAIALPAELVPPADLQTQLNAKEEENQTLRERLAALEAATQPADAPFQQPTE